MSLADDRPLAIALIDGEHYPPVVSAALRSLSGRFRFAAALFLGGQEKLRLRPGASLEDDYGLPVVATGAAWPPGVDGAGPRAAGGGTRAAERPEAVATRLGTAAARRGIPSLAPGNELLTEVMQLVRRTGADVVVDLSDEPVVGYRERFRLASAALAVGARYVGADFEFAAQDQVTLGVPAVAVIGTGKRVGKTAVCGRLARDARAIGGIDDERIVVVAMGRGGPPEPEVVRGAAGVGAAAPLAAARRRRHAAAAHYEDAALAGVTTIGSRRCGGGLAGASFDSNVTQALAMLDELPAELALLEGSGSVIPPAYADAVVCVAAATQPVDYIAGYLGTLRLLVSDLVVLTMCEEPFSTAAHVRAIKHEVRRLRPDLEMVETVFRPRPLQDVQGRRVAYFTTAASQGLELLREHLEAAYGADVVLVSGGLASRPALADAVRRATAEADLWLTEIKAAAIDLVAEAAAKAGKDLAFCDNEPVTVDGADLTSIDGALLETGRRRFAERRGGG